MSDQNKKKSYLSIFEEISHTHHTLHGKNGHAYPGLTEEAESLSSYEEEDIALTDELDHEILMHRDAHFGGDFDVMLAYYQEDHLGIHPEFDLERIAYLADVEKQLNQDLASLILSGTEAEKVAHARRAYEILKEVYERDQEEEKSPFPRLLADLILVETEEPTEEIEAVVAQGKRIVPELLQIVQSEDAYDPIFPGFGYAPYLAILCLGKIQDPTAIIPLFETLGREILFDEEVILEALHAIGEPAKHFLLGILKGRPITKDTVNAAWALTIFADQIDVSVACLQQLQDREVCEKILLRSYLLNNCEGLQATSHQEVLKNMIHDPAVPTDFRVEIEQIIKQWR